MEIKSKMFIFLLALVLGTCFFAKGSLAANHYVRTGATGANDGTSWTNAWTTFSSVTWTRGDIYYVAGGSYDGDVSIPTAESGSNWITLKKANADDNSGDPGWNSSYAFNQAIINGRLSISNGYVEVDGVTGSQTSGHGIKIHLDGNRAGLNAVIAYTSGTASPRHLHHLDIEGPGYDYGSTGSDGIYWNSNVVGSRGMHISNCWIHSIPRNGITLGTIEGVSYTDYGLLLENNVLERNGGVAMRYPNIHGQTIQFYMRPLTYSIIRNNTFRNAMGQSYISILGGVTTNYLRVYNNVFYSNNGDCTVYGLSDGGSTTEIIQNFKLFTSYENMVGRTLTNITKGATGMITSVSATTITMSGGISGGAVNAARDEFSFSIPCRSAYFLAASIYSSAGNPITNTEIYNNTFYNIGKAAITFITPTDYTGTVAKNNLWVNGYFTDTRSLWPPMTNAGYYNNIYGQYTPSNTETADPFVNSAAYDFHLKYTANAKDSGYNLSSIFNTDKVDMPRPQGVGWDIGAYEYGEEYVPDTTPPAVPSGLTIQ